MYFLGAEATGIYSIAAMLLVYGGIVKEGIGSTLLPSVQKLGAVMDYAGLKETLFLFARLTGSAGILWNVGFIAIGSAFITLWVGEDYWLASQLLPILSLAAMVRLVSANASTIFFSLGKLRLNSAISVLFTILNIGGTILLVYYTDLGIFGLALGTLISTLIVDGFIYPAKIMSVIRISLREYLSNIVIPMLIAAVGAYFAFSWLLTTYVVDTWPKLILSVVFAGLFYLFFALPIMFGPNKILGIIRMGR